MKIVTFLLVLAVIVASVVLILPTVQKTAQDKLLSGTANASNQAYAAVSLVFQDPVRGFTLRYPVGYAVTSEDGQSVSFYAPTDASLTEAHTFTVVDQNYSAQDLDALLKADVPDAKTTVSAEIPTASGRRVPLRQYVSTAGPTHLDLVQSLIPCNGYQLYYLGVVPDVVSSDTALGAYMVQTAVC